ncbi:hypothetical protein [Saccharothrix sp. NRRL B-16314]|uniref:hypothetical protein n=1 Tax=Saccharothrix sp. NRRL B-16314 TaxID=1463825 RepID=UPI0012DDF819|nr:hypothetical protein [Saccharothrix sp. NRRL B-16314]
MTDTEDSRAEAGGLMVSLPRSVVALATWSSWTRFDLLPAAAPRLPGVYLVATATELVYVGMAGDRGGAGLSGRMAAYCTGKAAVSGLGRAVLDRALNDVASSHGSLAVGERLDTQGWAVLAMREAGLWLCWATTADRATAVELEEHVLTAPPEQRLWNPRSSRSLERMTGNVWAGRGAAARRRAVGVPNYCHVD